MTTYPNDVWTKDDIKTATDKAVARIISLFSMRMNDIDRRKFLSFAGKGLCGMFTRHVGNLIGFVK